MNAKRTPLTGRSACKVTCKLCRPNPELQVKLHTQEICTVLWENCDCDWNAIVVANSRKDYSTPALFAEDYTVIILYIVSSQTPLFQYLWNVLFCFLSNFFFWMLVPWTNDMCLFHTSENYFGSSAGRYFDIIKIMRYGKNIEYPIIISWLSRYIAETQYDPKYCRLWKINHDSLTKNAALYCFKPIQNFTSRCPNICLSWTCTRRQARASLQPKNRSNFIHQKSIFRLGDISCYRRYFIDDNRLTFKSNTAHHYLGVQNTDTL